MTTFTIGDHSSSSTEDSLIPALFISNPDQALLQDEKNEIDSGIAELLGDLYGDLDTSTSSHATATNYEAEIARIDRREIHSKEIEDFRTINKFADKLLDGIKEEPLDVQKKTYDEFWDLF